MNGCWAAHLPPACLSPCFSCVSSLHAVLPAAVLHLKLLAAAAAAAAGHLGGVASLAPAFAPLAPAVALFGPRWRFACSLPALHHLPAVAPASLVPLAPAVVLFAASAAAAAGAAAAAAAVPAPAPLPPSRGLATCEWRRSLDEPEAAMLQPQVTGSVAAKTKG
eukprot:1161820-Pelagomonas_calceolata.AAC.1